MNDIPADLIYHPNELDKWLAETSVPLSDDEIEEMSAYFHSESFQYEENALCDTISKVSMILSRRLPPSR